MTDIGVPVIRSASKLVASFITFYKSVDPSEGYEYADKEFCRFPHPHQAHVPLDEGIYDTDKDVEFPIQVDSKLFPENPCNSILESGTPWRCVFLVKLVLFPRFCCYY